MSYTREILEAGSGPMDLGVVTAAIDACAEVCRACERACRVLLDAEVFAEYRAPAGG